MKKAVRGSLLDLILNIAVPFAIYTVAHKYFGLSDMPALALSALYPIFAIVAEYKKDHTLNFISVIVLIGTVTGIIGALIGGNPRLILIRESLFTFLLGIACFISLLSGKPLMFYFAREYEAGKDPLKRKKFSEILLKKNVLSFFRLLTIVWGTVFVLEFLLKLYIIYTFSISLNLVIAPLATYSVIFITIIWTFWYAKKRKNNQKTSQ